LFNYLNSTGLRVSKKTVNNFIRYGKSVFLFDEIYAWSRSLRKANQSRKKIYLTDPGFSLLFKRSDDMGKLLENAVMIELLRTKASVNMMEINYMEIGGKEVDFVVSRTGEIVEGINVTMELTQSNREREIKSLVEFMKKFKVKSGKIITFDTNDTVIVEGQKIEIISFINWELRI
jgi:predicted AAA+ superfamily ATPase